MRRIIELSIVVVMLAAALVTAERNRVTAPVGPQSILYFVADSERDLTRMPSRFTRIPDADEAKYGDALAAEIAAQTKLSAEDSEIERYLVSIGSRLAPHVRRRLKMQVHYLPDRELFNAFAIPGGHVFVGAGLVEQMRTEDQLAAVIAHEMEHVDHYHCAERLQVEAALRKIPLGFIVRIPVAVFQAGYSKEQELEADREGVLLAAASGYSAQGAVDVFALFERLEGQAQRAARTPQQELAQITLGAVTGYFRSHPLIPDRVAQVRAMIVRDPKLAANPQRPIGLSHVWETWKSTDAVGLGQFDKAADLARNALEASPDYAPALVALAESEYGRGRMAAAHEAHAAAIKRDAGAAAKIQTWIEERAAELAARNLPAQVLALLTNELVQRSSRVLQLSLDAQMAIGEVGSASATAAELQRQFPADADSVATRTAKDAGALLQAGQFARASATATVAGALRPGFTDAAQTLAAAQFGQANFAESARLWLELYDPETSDTGWVQAFGDAAGAARLASAPQDLAALIESRPPKILSVPAVKVEIAGLALLKGDDGPRRELQAWIDDGSITPDLLGRICWWHLRAARGDQALSLARTHSSYVSEYLRNAESWAMLDDADPGAALNSGDESAGSMLANSIEVRQALSAWQQSHSRDAVEKWSKATERRPQWREERWRNALYPPRINALARELEQRRLQGGALPAR